MPNVLTQPLIPEAPIRRVQEAMTTPHLDENPLWSRVKGFGAGALEGLRNLSSPAELAGLAMFAVPGGAAAEAPGIARTMGEAPAAVRGLYTAIPAFRTAGESIAEFAPRGGEAAFNAYRNIANPAEATYARMLPKVGGLAEGAGGVAHNSQAIADMARPGTQQMMEKLYNEANPAFKRLQEQGVFSGQR